jgi:hypothetical protein
MFDFMNKEDEEDSAAPEHHPFHLLDGDREHHEPTDEEKRRFIHKLIEAVLHYHISPSELSVDEIKDKQTIPTTLNQTKDTSTPFRIRAATKLNLLPPPPSYDVKLNFYAGLRKIPAIKAKNGIIHLVSLCEFSICRASLTLRFADLRSSPPSPYPARPATSLPSSLLDAHLCHPAD